jgi:hypothetical protein
MLYSTEIITVQNFSSCTECKCLWTSKIHGDHGISDRKLGCVAHTNCLIILTVITVSGDVQTNGHDKPLAYYYIYYC